MMRRMMIALLAFMIGNASATPFRVLVFPHQGPHPIPQGRETDISQVTLTSTRACNEYPAKLDTNHVWSKDGGLIQSSKSFYLSARRLRKQLRYNEADAFYFECSDPVKVTRESGMRAYSYEGNFVALIDPNDEGSVQLVNLIEPEKYVRGVVSSEVGSHWPSEALKAQAVAARTYAWWTVMNSRSSPEKSLYDFDDTVQYQAYLGTDGRSTAVDAAVTDTSRQVAKYAGKVIKAYFSADSGGRTEASENVFGDALPYCISKEELYNISKTTTAWERKLTLAEIGAAFSQTVKSVEVLPADVDESGRAKWVTLTASDGRSNRISGVVFRQALKLRSTLFGLKESQSPGSKSIVISGKGYGHGVGMAQIGAREYALQLGWTFDQILKFYYTDVTLESVTDEYTE